MVYIFIYYRFILIYVSESVKPGNNIVVVMFKHIHIYGSYGTQVLPSKIEVLVGIYTFSESERDSRLEF